MNSESQAEIGSQSVAGFLTGLAAKSPTLGGGAVAAITAALADALGSMVVRYSIGKRALAEHEALHQQSLTELEKLRVRALDHARADAEAYSRLNDLMRLPAEDPRRTAEWPAAVSAAIDAPMLVLIDALRLLSLLTDLAGKISAMLASDLAIAAVLCIGIGVAPQALYALLPYPVDYAPYTQSHVISQLQLLVFSAAAFAVLMRTGIYPPELRAINLDFDWFHRCLAPRFAHWAFDVHAHIRARAAAAAAQLGHACLERIRRAGGPGGLFERSSSSGRMALWVMVMLLGYLAMYHAP